MEKKEKQQAKKQDSHLGKSALDPVGGKSMMPPDFNLMISELLPIMPQDGVVVDHRPAAHLPAREKSKSDDQESEKVNKKVIEPESPPYEYPAVRDATAVAPKPPKKVQPWEGNPFRRPPFSK